MQEEPKTYNLTKSKQQFDIINLYQYGFRDYDAQLGRWHVRDPLAENYSTQSPYHFAGNNPINNFEINGAEYLNDIFGTNSLTEDVWGADIEMPGGNGGGAQEPGSIVIGEVNVTAKRLHTSAVHDFSYMTAEGYGQRGGPTGSSVLDGNGGDRIDPPDGEPGDPKPKKSIFDSGIVSYLSTVFYNLVFNETEIDGKNYVSTTTAQEKLPYYLALSLSGTFILGGGAGLDLTLGYVKNDGLFGNASLRVGFGVDMSLDAAMTVGSYSGFDKPTATSTAWANTYENIGFGLLSITFQQDVSSIGQTGALGLNWNYTSLGLTFGSKSIVGGSTGISLTTYPWYFYKFND